MSRFLLVWWAKRNKARVVVELPGDESRQLGAMVGYVVQVLLYDRVERRFLRLVSAVADQIGRVIQPGLRVDLKHDNRIY